MSELLVIDTPEHGCVSCLIDRNHSNSLETCIYCPIAGKSALDEKAEIIPDWCPLMDLPEKMKVTGIYNGEYFKAGGKLPSYKIGWNDCIDEITGGSSDD